MGTPVEPKPTKYFIAFLIADLALLPDTEAELLATMGKIDACAAARPWQESKFYAAEMGMHLWRGFWSLQSLIRSPAAAGSISTLGIWTCSKLFSLRPKTPASEFTSNRESMPKPLCSITMEHSTDCLTLTRII
jgi:hypothetical protein